MSTSLGKNPGMTEKDWHAWHGKYDDPTSSLSRRLAVVQARIRAALDDLAAGPVRVISVCAGQGRDLLGALEGHPRADDVAARLVELDPANAEVARRLAATAGRSGFEVVTGDASRTDAYDGAAPADLVLVCGVFGNVTDVDVEHTIQALPTLCAPRATVVWTRHRRAPDLSPSIRTWFADAGFDELAFDSPGPGRLAVGAHRFAGEPRPLPDPPQRLFTFVGYDELLSR